MLGRIVATANKRHRKMKEAAIRGGLGFSQGLGLYGGGPGSHAPSEDAPSEPRQGLSIIQCSLPPPGASLAGTLGITGPTTASGLIGFALGATSVVAASRYCATARDDKATSAVAVSNAVLITCPPQKFSLPRPGLGHYHKLGHGARNTTSIAPEGENSARMQHLSRQSCT